MFVLDKLGNLVKVLGEPGDPKSDPGCFYDPAGAVFLPDGTLLVADSRNHRIQAFDVESGDFKGVLDLPRGKGMEQVKRIAGLDVAQFAGETYLAVFHFQPTPSVTILKLNV